jgi:hypothetical protein
MSLDLLQSRALAIRISLLAKPLGSYLDPGVAALSLQCQAERRGDDARDQQHNHCDVLHGRQETSSENIILNER